MAEQAEPLAVFSHQGHAGGQGFGRMAKLDRPAVEQNLALRRLAAGAEQAFEQFGAAGTHQAGDAQDFAAAERKIDVLQPPLAGVAGPGERQMFDLQHFGPRRARTGEVGLFDLAADHQMRDPPRVGRGPIERVDPAAVAQHGDAIGQTEDFVHLVRDVQDRHPLAAQAIDHAKQPLDLGFGQGAGRLVHDQDFRPQRKGFGDFDQLLIADPQAAGRIAGRNAAFQLGQQLAGGVVHRPLIEQAPAVADFAAEKHIGGGRQSCSTRFSS